MSTKLGRAQFDYFKSWLDGQNHLARRPARRTHLPQRCSVEPIRLSHRAPGLSTAATLSANCARSSGIVEDMKAAAVKDEPKGTAFRGARPECPGRRSGKAIRDHLFFSRPVRPRAERCRYPVRRIRAPQGKSNSSLSPLQCRAPASAEPGQTRRTQPAAAPAPPCPRAALPQRSFHSSHDAPYSECSAPFRAIIHRDKSLD